MSNFTTAERRWFWAMVLFALLIRLGAAWYWHDQTLRSGATFRFGDSHSYWIMASNIANGGPYQYGSENSKIFRAPLYPLLLTPWTVIPRSWGPWEDSSASVHVSENSGPSPNGVWWARCMGCLFGAVAVACIMVMTRSIAGSHLALLSGIFASLYPGAVAMSIFILSEAVATPLVVLSCTIFLFGLREKNSRNQAYAAAGLAFGLACLARPSWSLWPLVLIPFAIVSAKPTSSSDLIRHLRSIGLFCAATMVVMTPWWIRNYTITGKFVPTTLQVGASLYDGWHTGASGSSDENMDFVLPFLKEQQIEDEMLAKQGKPLESTFEWRVDRRMKQAAIVWAWQNPSDVIRLGLVKLGKMWTPMPVAKEVQPLVRWSEGLGYSALVAGAVIGAWCLRREPGAWLAWMPCLYLALLHSIFIGSVRYRHPGVLLLCPLAAVGWMMIIEWIRRRDSRTAQRQTDSP